MLENLINPKRAEREPWQMFFIGLIYASIATLVPYFIFGEDYVNSKYLSWISIMFLVILTMPYMYYTIKLEVKKTSLNYDNEKNLLKQHGKAILSFLWLFLGFVFAFSIIYILLPDAENLFKAQIEVFCQINRQSDYFNCLNQHGIAQSEALTGAITSSLDRVLGIFSNNIQVLMLTLIFSLVFGAGAIFILAWNASVIAAAIKIFIESDLSRLFSGIARYLIHGLPEISAYFVAALAGGILSMTVIKKNNLEQKLTDVLFDVLILVIIAIGILLLSALIEVFITPKLF